MKSIGNGAQADVYLTYDELLETEIAIKVVESSAQDPQSLNSIRNEVLLAGKLQHPNIIRIFDVYEDSREQLKTLDKQIYKRNIIYTILNYFYN